MSVIVNRAITQYLLVCIQRLQVNSLMFLVHVVLEIDSMMFTRHRLKDFYG